MKKITVVGHPRLVDYLGTYISANDTNLCPPDLHKYHKKDEDDQIKYTYQPNLNNGQTKLAFFLSELAAQIKHSYIA